MPWKRAMRRSVMRLMPTSSAMAEGIFLVLAVDLALVHMVLNSLVKLSLGTERCSNQTGSAARSPCRC